MNKIFLVQQYPYEDWETVAYFDNEVEAVAKLNELEAIHDALPPERQYNNFKVKAIFDNSINRNFYGVN
jgi:hypothetical protein